MDLGKRALQFSLYMTRLNARSYQKQLDVANTEHAQKSRLAKDAPYVTIIQELWY